jgi:hypothetical protein
MSRLHQQAVNTLMGSLGFATKWSAVLLQVKSRVMAATQWPDNAATHLATAMITGVVSTTATNPVDVIKTYMFVGERGNSVYEDMMNALVRAGTGWGLAHDSICSSGLLRVLA